MKITTKTLALAASLAIATTGLVGCSKNAPEATAKSDAASASATPSASDSAAADGKKDDNAGGEEKPVGAVAANQRPDECGLQEQAGPEATFGPFDGAIHYFQPGDMFYSPDAKMKMLPYKDSQMHLEFDLKANTYATNWGYSVDETPADLRVVYKLDDPAGKTISSGHFMEMNAIDGSHYGVNLPKDTITAPGAYKLTVTIYPPQSYALHQDYITGVPAAAKMGWFKPLTVTMPWDIKQTNLDTIKSNTVADFMNPSDKCKSYPVKVFKDPAAEKAMQEAESAQPLPLAAG